MLVSALKKSNEYDYAEFRIKQAMPDVGAMQKELNGYHEEHNLINGKKLIRKENFTNGSLFSKCCEPRLNNYRSNDKNNFNGYIFGNVDAANDLLGKDEVRQLSKKIAVNLGWDSDEENRWNDMSKGSEASSAMSTRSYPTRFSPETVASACLNWDGSNDDSSMMSDESESSRGNGVLGVGSSKLNAALQPGLPTTSKNMAQDSRIQISTDDEPNFDIFDLMCSDEEVSDCAQLFSEKDELSVNGDLINKYENNLGLDIVKDKNVCWAAGNFDNEVCPLRSYEPGNENSLWSFSKENLESESRESFSQGWAFDESIENVSQDHMPEPQIIVPKKTVDITKIKGWRKKQFTVEKCLANSNSVLKKEFWKTAEAKERSTEKCEDRAELRGGNEDQSKDYAFVCDRLDDFLDQEAELKINYEIPHLYAECGIKLTSEELVSRPKFMNETKPPHLKRPAKSSIPPAKTAQPTASNGRLKRRRRRSTKGSPGKKPSPKSKSALPSKSQSQWSAVKEGSSPKDRQTASLKKESPAKKVNAPAASAVVPCRRSTRTQQSSELNKSKLKPNHMDGVSDRVKVEKSAVNSLEPVARQGPMFNFHPDYRLTIRKFGMVLYPGPYAPLNPFIRAHLQKIRSYRTYIDENWARFAASAVVVNGKTQKRRRMILPLTCCFKSKVEPEAILKQEEESDECKTQPVPGSEDNEMKAVRETVENLSNLVCSQAGEDVKLGAGTEKEEASSENPPAGDTNISNDTPAWSLEPDGEVVKQEVKDSRSPPDSSSRDVGKAVNNGDIYDLDCYVEEVDDDVEVEVIHIDERNSKERASGDEKDSDGKGFRAGYLPNDLSNLGNPLAPPNSHKMTFDRNITKLLGKKLNQIKSRQMVNSSIDELKTVKPSALELIKLAFVKENFLSGYINLWYDKGKGGRKSRVFLTFSMNPPVEGAINFKMVSRFSRDELPNIINEIITKDDRVDSNDFAILYCDGKQWEILGSVNVGLGKSESGDTFDEMVQVFHLKENVLPELKLLRQVKVKRKKCKVIKWWVMHMMQDYTDVVIKLGDEVGRISRSVIMKTWKTKVPSYIEFKGLTNKRPMGIAINPRLWPYFLIGPYYVSDQHGLSLKLNSEIVPFEYYLPLDRIKPKFHLKRFVSWVIMHSWRNCRQVVGMWLYDRMVKNQSTYIEVKTKVKKARHYEPKVEHDYSLSQEHDYNLSHGQDGEFEARVDCVPKARGIAGKDVALSSEDVFLVPNIPNLGYIKGLLNPDNSITIDHPLKPGRKIKSHHIFDWLNKLIKRRIRFIPNDLDLKWSIIKNAELLSRQKPLDRFSLGGTHILCKKGLFYLLSLTKEKIRSLELDESFVMDVIVKNPIIQEVIELKKLARILSLNDKPNLNMEQILEMALAEIAKLQKEDTGLQEARLSKERERKILCLRYVKALETCGIDENAKKTIQFYIKRILENRRNGKEIYSRRRMLSENFQCLYSISRFVARALFKLPKDSGDPGKPWEGTPGADVTGRVSPEVKLIDEGEANLDAGENPGSYNEIVEKFETKIKTFYEILKKYNSGDPNLYEELQRRLNAMSQHLEKFKNDARNQGAPTTTLAEEENEVENKSPTPDISQSQDSSESYPDLEDDSKSTQDDVSNLTTQDVEEITENTKDGTSSNKTDETGTQKGNGSTVEPVVEIIDDSLEEVEAETQNRLPVLEDSGEKAEEDETTRAEAAGGSAECGRSSLLDERETGDGPTSDKDDEIEIVELAKSNSDADSPPELNHSEGQMNSSEDVMVIFPPEGKDPEVSGSMEGSISESHNVSSLKGGELGWDGEKGVKGHRDTSENSADAKPYKYANNSIDSAEGKQFTMRLKKAFKVKVLKPTFLSDALTIEDVGRRGADTTGNGKKAIVISKRKSSGECQYDLYKKLRTS